MPPIRTALANFALFDLVGKQLSPRIRDLGKITLYRTGGKTDFTDRYPLVGPLLTEMMFVSTSRRGLTQLLTDFGSLTGFVGPGREVLVHSLDVAL